MSKSIEQLKTKKLMDNIELAVSQDNGIEHSDSWSNLASGVGTAKNKDTYNKFNVGTELPTDDPIVIDSLCRGDRLARKICEMPIKDAIKNGYIITGDKEEAIKRSLIHLKFNEALEQCGIDSRKFGGGVILMIDGMSLEKELTGKTKITKLINYTNLDFRLDSTDKDLDIMSNYFNDYKYLYLRKQDGTEVKVHRSRLLIMKGRSAGTATNATHLQDKLLYWGDSELAGIYDSIGRYAIALKCSGTALQELNVSVLSLEGLGELLSSMASDDSTEAQEASATFMKRLEAMSLTKSLVNMVFIDAEQEKLTNKSIVLSGIQEIISVLQMDLSGKTDIPITKLFGRSPAGENSTGESDTANYDSMTMDIQLDMRPLIQTLINLLTGDMTSEKHVVTFKHPSPPTEEKLTEMQETRMKTITGYAKEGLLDEADVRDMVLRDLGISKND